MILDDCPATRKALDYVPHCYGVPKEVVQEAVDELLAKVAHLAACRWAANHSAEKAEAALAEARERVFTVRCTYCGMRSLVSPPAEEAQDE